MPFFPPVLSQVRDVKSKKPIGELSVKLSEVMAAEDLVLDQKFVLKGAEPNSAVNMIVVLRVCCVCVARCVW